MSDKLSPRGNLAAWKRRVLAWEYSIHGNPSAGLRRQIGRNWRYGWCIQTEMLVRRAILGFYPALTLGLVLLTCATCTRAESAAIPHGTLELVAENQWITAGHDFNLGLHFELEKGWHIYWINPGDSGEPPRVKWQLPEGVTAGALQWPTPRRLGTPSIVDFGYQDAVTLIIPMHAAGSLGLGEPAKIGAQIKVLVCREMCIPGSAQLSLVLPVKSESPAPDGRTRNLFIAARKSLPRPAPTNWKLNSDEEKGSFVTANVGHEITQAAFFPVAESQISNAAAQKLVPTAGGFRLTLQKSDQLLKPIERLKGVLVFSDDQSYLIDVPVNRAGSAKS
jgi:DsbC/DsbD-like thiol-disulfide interchange protein